MSRKVRKKSFLTSLFTLDNIYRFMHRVGKPNSCLVLAICISQLIILGFLVKRPNKELPWELDTCVCHTRWWGSKDFGLDLPDNETLRKMLPRNSVMYVLGTCEDLAVEVELAQVTGAVIHVVDVKDEDALNLEVNNVVNDKSLDHKDAKRSRHKNIIYHKANTTKARNLDQSLNTKSTSTLGKIGLLTLLNAMQEFDKTNIDLLKINLQHFSLRDFSQIFRLKIFPRIIIILKDTLHQASDGNRDWIMNRLRTYGYLMIPDSRNSHFCTFILKGCLHSQLLQRAQQISLQSGYVNLQFFNLGFLNMTKSWICNVRSLPGVLPATLFIASDSKSYSELLELKNVNVMLDNFNSPTSMKYGETTYYSFTLYRTELILQLLENNISVWSTESDAYWKASPFDEMNPIVEIYVANNRANTRQEASVGMIFLRATEEVVRLWKNLLAWRKVNPDTQEQNHLTRLINETEAFVQWLPSLEYISGLWYLNPKLHTGKEKVIQNNFIVGNEAKEKRAKLHGHWFLHSDGSCKLSTAQS